MTDPHPALAPLDRAAQIVERVVLYLRHEHFEIARDVSQPELEAALRELRAAREMLEGK